MNDELRALYLVCRVQSRQLSFALANDNDILERLILRRLVCEIMRDGWTACMSEGTGMLRDFVRSDAQAGETVPKAIADYHKLGTPANDTDACS